MALSTGQRIAIYSSGRSVLTPAQRRRVRHKQNSVNAPISRSMRRHAHADIKRLDRRRRNQIRNMFALMRAGFTVKVPR